MSAPAAVGFTWQDGSQEELLSRQAGQVRRIPVLDRGADVLHGRWIQRLRALNRPETVEVACVGSAPEVLRRLSQQVAPSDWRATPYGVWSSRVVKGAVKGHRLRLYAGRRGRGNSWRRLLYAEVQPAGTGSVIRGELRLAPVVKGFMGAWAVILGLFHVIAVVAVIGRVVTGDRQTLGALSFLGLLLLFDLAVGGMVALFTAMAAPDERYLLEWVDRLVADLNAGR